MIKLMKYTIIVGLALSVIVNACIVVTTTNFWQLLLIIVCSFGLADLTHVTKDKE